MQSASNGSEESNDSEVRKKSKLKRGGTGAHPRTKLTLYTYI
jgi:hypothetical protein